MTLLKAETSVRCFIKCVCVNKVFSFGQTNSDREEKKLFQNNHLEKLQKRKEKYKINLMGSQNRRITFIERLFVL